MRCLSTGFHQEQQLLPECRHAMQSDSGADSEQAISRSGSLPTPSGTSQTASPRVNGASVCCSDASNVKRVTVGSAATTSPTRLARATQAQ